jgi:hypothetical protein
MKMMGYLIVDVAQKLSINYYSSNGNLGASHEVCKAEKLF